MDGNSNKKVSKKTLGKIAVLLENIDPDVDLEELFEVMDKVYVETNGSEEGLMILDDWAHGGDGVPTGNFLKSLWNRNKVDRRRYFGIGGLMTMAGHPEAIY